MSDAPLTFGLDLGGTKCLGVALRADEVLAEIREETPDEGTEAVLELLARVAAHLVAESEEPVAVGVGAPGLVTRDGFLALAPNVAGIENLDLAIQLSARVDCPVVVDNDAAAAAWGEFVMGAARDVESSLMITLGTGVGGGVVLNGQLVRGANGFAAEVGHMTLRAGGRECVCGKRGCWEAYASGTALGLLARERLGPASSAEQITANAAAGDPAATAVLDEFATDVAQGLGSLIEILDPEMIVIGGGLGEAGEVLLDPVRRCLPDFVYSWKYRPPTPVVAAKLGGSAGAIGAALLARIRS